MKLIPLSMWAARRYGENVPSSRTLRRWRTRQLIEPLPEKNGRTWYVVPHAVAYENEDAKPPVLERVFGPLATEIFTAPKPAFVAYKESFELLSIDKLANLPKVTSTAKHQGIYFLWAASALMYIGESANVYRRYREHATQDHKPFTHATFLNLPSIVAFASSRRWCEEQYVLKYSPLWNRTRHG